MRLNPEFGVLSTWFGTRGHSIAGAASGFRPAAFDPYAQFATMRSWSEMGVADVDVARRLICWNPDSWT